MSVDEHFFRHEWARLVAVLTRIFGVHNLALAEDVAQDALWRAMETWQRTGMPAQPSAWLTTVAKRRAIDELRRARTEQLAAPELARLLDSEWTRVPLLDEVFEHQPLRDDELRLMFSLAQPRLPEASQLALILHLSCGFGETEIGAALLASPVAVGKRLQRAKKVLRSSRSLFALTGADLPARLACVRRAVYLLFNEGYHGAGVESVVRVDLCHEALRLVDLLVGHPATRTPETIALAALLHLHAARLPARLDEHGELLPFSEQRRAAWDQELVERGLALLDAAATGDELTVFHLEAAIAACHATSPSAEATPWEQIVSFYDVLMRIEPSPIVALNRAIAVAQAHGPEQGLVELRAVRREDLDGYVFFHAALGTLTSRVGDGVAARAHFERAVELARSPAERAFLERDRDDLR